MSVSRVRENRTHGSMWRREATQPLGPGRAVRPRKPPADPAARARGARRVQSPSKPSRIFSRALTEAAGIELVLAEALDDRPDRVPVDPQHPVNHGLVDASRQPRHEASKSRVNSDLGPGEQDALVRRPLHRAQWPPGATMDLISCQNSRSTWRQTEFSGRVSLRTRVEYVHSGQISRRRRTAARAGRPNPAAACPLSMATRMARTRLPESPARALLAHASLDPAATLRVR